MIKILTHTHSMVGSLSNGKNMRRNLISPFCTVQAYSPHGIDRKPLVRVYSNTEQARVGLYINIINIRNAKHVFTGGVSSKPCLWYENDFQYHFWTNLWFQSDNPCIIPMIFICKSQQKFNHMMI